MHDERAYLLDLIKSARKVSHYVAGRTYDDFKDDDQFQDAVIRRLSIIGEAARFITPATRQRLPEVPWDDVVRMRNILIHVYFGVQLDRIWQTATDAVPQLIDAPVREFPSLEGQ